jgi:hypothetical protein
VFCLGLCPCLVLDLVHVHVPDQVHGFGIREAGCISAPYVVTAVREVLCGGSAGCELVFGVGRLLVSPVLAGSSMVVGAPLRVLPVVVALVVAASSRRVDELPLLLSEIEDCVVLLLSWPVGWSTWFDFLLSLQVALCRTVSRC